MEPKKKVKKKLLSGSKDGDGDRKEQKHPPEGNAAESSVDAGADSTGTSGRSKAYEEVRVSDTSPGGPETVQGESVQTSNDAQINIQHKENKENKDTLSSTEVQPESVTPQKIPSTQDESRGEHIDDDTKGDITPAVVNGAAEERKDNVEKEISKHRQPSAGGGRQESSAGEEVVVSVSSSQSTMENSTKEDVSISPGENRKEPKDKGAKDSEVNSNNEKARKQPEGDEIMVALLNQIQLEQEKAAAEIAKRESLEKQVDELRASNKTLKEKYEAANAELTALRMEVKRLRERKEKSFTTTGTKDKQGSVDDAERVAESSSTVSNLTAEAEKRISELMERLEKEVAKRKELEAIIDTRIEKFDQILNAADLLTSREIELQKMEQEVQERIESISSKEKLLLEKEDGLLKKEEEIAKRLEDISKEMEKLTQTKQNMEMSEQSLKEKEREIENAMKEIEQKRKELEMMKEDLENESKRILEEEERLIKQRERWLAERKGKFDESK